MNLSLSHRWSQRRWIGTGGGVRRFGDDEIGVDWITDVHQPTRDFATFAAAAAAVAVVATLTTVSTRLI